MAEQNVSGGNALRLCICWLVVGLPFACDVCKPIVTLPALFK